MYTCPIEFSMNGNMTLSTDRVPVSLFVMRDDPIHSYSIKKNCLELETQLIFSECMGFALALGIF